MRPTPQTMKILRKMIRDIEAMNGLHFGNESWKIIKDHAGQIDERWQNALDKEIQAIIDKKESE